MSELAPKSHSEEIRERREKVASMIRSKTEEAIAEELGCSRETVARDVAFLKKTAQDWLDNLADNGFVLEYQNAFNELKENRGKLQKLLETETDKEIKRKIIKDIDTNIILYIKLLSEGPTVLAFRKKIGGGIVSTA